MILGKYTVRDLQLTAVNNVRAVVSRLRKEQPTGQIFVLLVGPCGFGKTITSSVVMDGARNKGIGSIFLAYRRLLITQKALTLSDCDIPHTVMMDGFDYDKHQRVIVASKDTYSSRCLRNRLYAIPDAGVILVDEAHRATGAEWKEIFDAYPNAVFIGLTATPALGNGKALPLYKEIVVGATYSQLLQDGLLVPAEVFAPFVVDMSGVKVNAESGEYVETQAVEKFTNDELVGDVIRDWRKYGDDRTTAVFGASVDHSIYLAKQFNAAGIPAAHIDAMTPDEERREILEKAKNREIRCLCNFEVYTTGADFPWVECVQLVRAIKSVVNFLQIVGRGLRIHTFDDGRVKRNCIIIDHGGNVHKHGWPTSDHEWSLDPGSTVQERDAKKSPPKERQPITCPICGACREKGPECPKCGHKHTRNGIKVRMANGELKPLKEKSLKPQKTVSDDQKAWIQCLSVAFHRNMTVNAARAMFNKKLGHWPPDFVQPQVEFHKGNLPVPVVFPNWGRAKKGGDA